MIYTMNLVIKYIVGILYDYFIDKAEKNADQIATRKKKIELT